MSKDDGFVSFVCDQLETLGDVRSKSMFGGFGLYSDSVFFAIVASGRLYFKTSAQTRARYEAAGMGPFAPKPDQVLKNYYEVPVDVLEDDGELTAWAKEAIDAARS